MSIDRIVLGNHANTQLGSGLFVSTPGANVSHPEYAQYGNLMFDTNEPHSTLNIIQSGTFKITCKRQAFSPRGENIGTRKADTFEIQRMVSYDSGQGWRVPPWTIGVEHTFAFDTGRPAALSPIANDLFGTIGTDLDDPGNFGLVGSNFPPTHDSGEYSGRSVMSAGARTSAKQGNYLDKGTHTFAITNPLPDGEIPEVALRFAVGTDENQIYPYPYTGQIGPTFHPWYANTKTTGDGGSWSDIDYDAYLPAGTAGKPTSGTANASQIVHMDSNWMRLKWGGLGAEEYRGIQDEYNFDSLLDFFGDAQSIVDKFGFDDEADARDKLDTNSKLLSLAVTNAQGIVGLIPYVNATSVTVDAYMTPTHSGLRQPIDRTFEVNAGKQKGIGFNAIDDFAHINFPIEYHPHTNRFWWYDTTEYGRDNQTYNELVDGQTIGNHPHHLVMPKTISSSYVNGHPDSGVYAGWYYIVKHRLHAKLFKELPGIPEVGNMFNAKSNETIMSPINEPDHGKRDMYGWGGHPTEFFVNPFSNANLTFYTHMQPPYVRRDPAAEPGEVGEYLPGSIGNVGGGYYGQYWPVTYTNEAGMGGTPYWLLLMPNLKGNGPQGNYPLFGNHSDKNAMCVGYFPHKTANPTPGQVYDWYFPPPRTRNSSAGGLTGGESWPGWGPDFSFIQGSAVARGPATDETDNDEIWWYTAPNFLFENSPTGSGVFSRGNEASLREQWPEPGDGEANIQYAGHGQNFTDTLQGGDLFDRVGMWGTAWMPMPGVFNGAGIKWPAGHPRADFLDHRDWIGSMGLGGAGSKESLAAGVDGGAANIWDTFYVSYVVYSNGSVPPPEASVDPGTGFSYASPDPGSNKVSQDLWGGYGGKGVVPSVINNFIFPDDLVGTVGDPATDPFASNRDATGRIYGNMHFNLNLEPGKNYGSDKFSTTTSKPLPAITLDFSETKWNFNNNKGISLTINNHSRIVGGGGAGGFGSRRAVTITKVGDVSDGATGGGGGGGGGGTGRNQNYGTAETDPSYVGYLGVGFQGKGWGQEILFTPTLLGDDGAQGTDFFDAGAGGAKADVISTQNITGPINFFRNGGDGGDAIEVIHPINIQPLIEIVNSNTGIIMGGGGGGAGGYEVDGGDGGDAGEHGKNSMSIFSAANTGGNPGYVLVGTNDSYYRSVRITNINNGIVQGRNPWLDSHDVTDTSGGAPGVWVLTGNSTVDSSLPATGIYREGI
jgi:hypothetical protein